MLKLAVAYRHRVGKIPAAFRRLCVETVLEFVSTDSIIPAAFRRLCVETRGVAHIKHYFSASRL